MLGSTPDRHYIWVREQDGPQGERRYRKVARVGSREVAKAVQAGLEAAGREVAVRRNDARHPY